MPICSIAVFPTLSTLEEFAAVLAERLNLPLTLDRQAVYDYLVIVTPDYIGLQKRGGTPLYVDFLSRKVHYRSRHVSFKNEALVRAMGLKGKTNPKIVDATGGLASDAFILASLGFEVTVLERSCIIYTLTTDGIRRAKKDSHIASVVDRLHLIYADAMAWFDNVTIHERPEIIYLDPMFPERKKSALPKQKMLILHDIVGPDVDANELLKAALACAAKRVVVKRPRLADVLIANPAPSFSLSGSSSRFDVYLT